MFVVPENAIRCLNRTLTARFYDYDRFNEPVHMQGASDLVDELLSGEWALLSRWTSPRDDPMAAVANIVVNGQHIIVMSVPNQSGRLYSEGGVYPDVDVDYSELIPRKVKRVRRTRKRAVAG